MVTEHRVEMGNIESLMSNIDLIDTCLLSQSITDNNHNLLLVDSRDTTFALKKAGYNGSFAVPGYDLTDKFKNMMRNNINAVYLLEHKKINDVALHFINSGIAVYILKDIDNAAILRMSKKEIERNCTKEAISYYKYQYLLWCKETNFQDYPHILEDKMRELFKLLDFYAIEKNPTECKNLDRWLQDALMLTNQYYELSIYPLVKHCFIRTLSSKSM